MTLAAKLQIQILLTVYFIFFQSETISIKYLELPTCSPKQYMKKQLLQIIFPSLVFARILAQEHVSVLLKSHFNIITFTGQIFNFVREVGFEPTLDDSRSPRLPGYRTP